MNKRDIRGLLDRFHKGETTPEEEVQLDLWYHNEVGLSDWIPDKNIEETGNLLKYRIDAEIDHVPAPKYKNWYYAAAAIIFVLLSTGLYFFMLQHQSTGITTAQLSRTKDIAPGDNKAMLTLADGSKISLTDAVEGKLATQSGIVITKTADGQLVYTVNSAAPATANGVLSYNTISTPRGGQHQINLPDGTRVWLNSGSSLKFPVNFSDLKVRKVELLGEAYFEVKANKNRPFSVMSGAQAVKVFGTHFNVMAYPNETNVETTLLEGSVSVKAGLTETFIIPGQQSQLNSGKINVLKLTDPEAMVAWKNQLFQFDNTDIDKVLRQIERWYDVDVTYAGTKPEVSFTGVVPRDVKVSKILMALEQACGVKFEIKGKNIIVNNNITKH
jgi:transmembrane sensor